MIIFANNAVTTLAVALLSSQTTLQVLATTGELFPVPGVGDYFKLTLEDRRNRTIEICHCTGRAGDVLTIVRAQEDTLALNFAIGTTVANRFTRDTPPAILAQVTPANPWYLGPFAVAPVLDNEGNPLAAGMQYWNTAAQIFYIYDGASWIDIFGGTAAISSVSGTYMLVDPSPLFDGIVTDFNLRYTDYVAAVQTPDVTIAEQFFVWLDGVRLKPGTDYTIPVLGTIRFTDPPTADQTFTGVWIAVTAGPAGAAGPPGADGAAGPPGADSVVPGPAGPAGSQGIQGIQGIQGPAGAAGAAGADGADGEQWFSGAGVPAGGLGIVGDFYLDNLTGDVYEKTGAATWTLVANIQGPAGAGTGDMVRSVYDPDFDGKVVSAVNADVAPWAGLTGVPATFPPSAHTHPESEVTGLVADLAAKAPIASPTFTGKVTLAAAAAGFASLNMPVGSAPSAPADGDMWIGGTSLFIRLSGVTDKVAIIGNAHTWADKQTFKVGSTASAPIRLQVGVAPTSPLAGDLWTTSTRLVARINGVSEDLAFLSEVALAAHTHAFSALTGIPTTIAGYGITDFVSLGDAEWAQLVHTHAFSALTGIPTTIGGYGITDFNSLGDARWSLTGHTHATLAPLASPTFTGVPAAPTAAPGTNTTQLATTAFVEAAIAAAAGGSSVTISDTAPGTPSAGDMWWNSADGNLYVYYDDGTSAQWVAASTLGTPVETGVVSCVIDGGGVTITTGIKGDIGPMTFAGEFTEVTMLADQSGSIVVDVWKDTYANFPPTVADTITAADKPTITTATKSQDATLTGWTIAFAIGDILRFNVDSVTTIQRLALTLKYEKT